MEISSNTVQKILKRSRDASNRENTGRMGKRDFRLSEMIPPRGDPGA